MDRAPKESTSAILKAVTSPMVFNAFSILGVSGIVSATAWLLPTPYREGLIVFGLLWIVALTGWVNWQAKTDPRSMVYGESAYIEESKLAAKKDTKRSS